MAAADRKYGNLTQNQQRLSPREAAEPVASCEDGSTIGALASRFNVNRTTVLAHVEQTGIPRHSELGQWDRATLTAAARLYEEGHSLATIGEQFGVHARTVATRLRRGGSICANDVAGRDPAIARTRGTSEHSRDSGCFTGSTAVWA